MTIRIRAIRTGSVQVKTAQRVRKPGGLLRVLTDTEWTEWLPIYAWVIDHPEGLIVVDSGETARASDRGYFPAWHPYYRWSVRMDVKPDEEIGPQLRSMGIREQDVRTLVLTHFHTDHAGGLHHFPHSEILVSNKDLKLASGLKGRLQGYLPHRWPDWFDPTPVAFQNDSFGPFDRYMPLTQAGDVVIVPTAGHTPGHVSVIARDEDICYFLAGDTSYTQELLQERIADGISPNADVTMATINRIMRLAQEEPVVYLPSHDAESIIRLEGRKVLGVQVKPQVEREGTSEQREIEIA